MNKTQKKLQLRKIVGKIKRSFQNKNKSEMVTTHKWRNLSSDLYGKYLKDDHPDRVWFVELVKETVPCSVLEIGAGSLHEVRQLFELEPPVGLKYTVADVAVNMIEKGKEEFPAVEFVEANVNDLIMPANMYDIVYCRHVVEHQPYYKKSIREMLRVSKGLVIINLFRWSLHHDIIREGKYFSNAYEINKFLKFVSKVSADAEHFLVLKADELGETAYEDENIRRTGDHLVVVLAKDASKWDSDKLYQVLDQVGAKYQHRPYHD